MYTRFLDPIGPDSRAWACFDAALEAYHAAPASQGIRHHYHFHRYANQRYLMVKALRAEGASESLVSEWLASLQQQWKLVFDIREAAYGPIREDPKLAAFRNDLTKIERDLADLKARFAAFTKGGK